MLNIRNKRENFEDRTRRFNSIKDPSSYIEQDVDKFIDNAISVKPIARPTVVRSNKKLFATKHSDSLANSTKREKAMAELIGELSNNNITVVDNSRYVSSPYSYSKIDEFFRKESYFSRSVYRQIETMMRNGYVLNSDNPKAVQIVKRELARISRASRIDFNQFLFQVARQILTYGMCVTRKLKDPTTKKITRFTTIKPHNVVFRFNNETGEILSVTDRNPSMFGKALRTIFKNIKPSTNTYSANEIPINDIGICLLYDAGEDIFPEPPCFQLLDDILTLRSLEETVELLSFQFGSPLLHVSVGSKESPATKEEIIEAI